MPDEHRLVRSGVKAVAGYVDKGRAGINLGNNQSLFPPSPRVLEALRSLDDLDPRAYPERTSRSLRDALAKHHGVHASRVITGNGSDDAIDMVIRVFAGEGDAVAYTPPTFEMFYITTMVCGATPRPVPLGADFSLPVKALVEENARLTIIASPNNPTSNAFPMEQIERVVSGVDGIVLLDEAYAEFNDEDGSRFLSRDNVVLTRTFSKAYGLAGARVGYALAPPAIAGALDKARGPYRLNTLSERLALAALEDQAHLKDVVQKTRAERARVTAVVERMGLQPLPSASNFLFCRHRRARELEAAIERRGFLVRAFAPPIQDRFRFTIGPPELNDRFLSALGAAIAEVGP